MIAKISLTDVHNIETTAIALRGAPKYGGDFQHFAYANPQAPQGGMLRDYAIGTFDSLNAFAQRGHAVIGGWALYATLMTDSADKDSVFYPLIAERLR